MKSLLNIYGVKKQLLFLLLFAITVVVQAQNISVNKTGESPDPSSMLDVSDTASGVLVPRMTQLQRDAIANPATGLLIFQTDNDSGFYFNQGIPALPNWLRIKSEADTNLWNQSGTDIYYNGGFVGVGTDDPQGVMNLYSTGNFGAGSRIIFGDDYHFINPGNGVEQNVFVGEAGWQNNTDTDVLQIHGRRGQLFTLDGGTGSSSYDTMMIFDDFGDIGIGTGLPSSKFDISLPSGNFQVFDFVPASGSVLMGSWSADTAAPEVRYINSLSNNFVDVGLDGDQNFVIQPNDNNRFTFHQNGELHIGYKNLAAHDLFLGDTSGNNVFTRLSSTAGQTGLWVNNDSITWALFSDRNGGTIMHQSSVGLFLTNGTGSAWTVNRLGYMGVNVDSALSQFHISTNEVGALIRLNQDVNSQTAELVYDIADTAEWTTGATGLNHPYGEGFFWYNVQRNHFDLFLDGNNGFFGLATVDPQALLDVRGNAIIGDSYGPTATDGVNKLTILSGVNGDPTTNGITFHEFSGFGMSIGYDGLGTGANNKLNIYGSVYDTLFTFTNGGLMGVGVEAPSSQVHAYRNGYGSIFRLDQGSSIQTSEMAFDVAGQTLYNIGASGSAHSFGEGFFMSNFTRNNVDFFLDGDNGFLGVGTISPTRRLHLNESTGTGSYVSFTNTSTGTTSGDGSLIGSSGLNMYVWNYENGFTSFRTNNTERMRITSDGKIGIGTTNPIGILGISSGVSAGSPALYLNGFSSTEGTISTPVGQHIYFGTYDSGTSTFTSNVIFGSAGRVGFGTTAPSTDLHIKQSVISTTGGSGGIRFEEPVGTNFWQVYHSGIYLSFAVNGTRMAYINNTTGAWVDVSDSTMKKDIAPMPTVLSGVNGLNLYQYRYKHNQSTDKLMYGFMAQEVREVFPNLVSEGEDGKLGLEKSGFGVIAIKAIQEQQEEIDSLKKDIEALLDRIEQLESGN